MSLRWFGFQSSPKSMERQQKSMEKHLKYMENTRKSMEHPRNPWKTTRNPRKLLQKPYRTPELEGFWCSSRVLPEILTHSQPQNTKNPWKKPKIHGKTQQCMGKLNNPWKNPTMHGKTQRIHGKFPKPAGFWCSSRVSAMILMHSQPPNRQKSMEDPQNPQKNPTIHRKPPNL